MMNSEKNHVEKGIEPLKVDISKPEATESETTKPEPKPEATESSATESAGVNNK